MDSADALVAPLPWSYLFAGVMGFNSIVFFLSQVLDDLSIVDISWGIMHIIPNLLTYYQRVIVLGQQPSPIMLLNMAMVAIWGARLSLHIGARHKGEDYRYKIIKKRWAHRSYPMRLLWAYMYIFGMQGFFSMITGAAALHVTQYVPEKATLQAIDFVGAGVWLTGFLFEVIGDMQLQAFRDDPNKKEGSIITSGLWRYTRHPNYFGEVLSWWGVYIVACGQQGGVPMLERKQKKKAAFRLYMRETNAFIPMPCSPVPENERAALLKKFQAEIDKEEAEKEAAKSKESKD